MCQACHYLIRHIISLAEICYSLLCNKLVEIYVILSLRKGHFASLFQLNIENMSTLLPEILLAKLYGQSVKIRSVDKFTIISHFSFQILFINSKWSELQLFWFLVMLFETCLHLIAFYYAFLYSWDTTVRIHRERAVKSNAQTNWDTAAGGCVCVVY